MHAALAGLFIAAFMATPARAAGDLTVLSLVRTESAQVGDISFGATGRRAECRVTRGRCAATIDFTELYQARYGFGGATGSCARRRGSSSAAHTPVAKLVLQRIDPTGTVYDDPRVVIIDDTGLIL